MDVTVKVDSHMLGTGHILFTVGLEFRKLLAVLFKPDCTNEFCPGRSFISFELLLFGPVLGLLSFSLLSFFPFFFFLLFLLLSLVLLFLFLFPVRILFGLLRLGWVFLFVFLLLELPD